jgi:hypothetical protein
VPLPIDNNFSGSDSHQIMVTEQIHDSSKVTMSCHWRVLYTERTCNNSIAIWTRICFCAGVKKWETHRRCRTVRRSDWVGCRRRVDLGRQILRESSRPDETGNGNSARAGNIASSTGLRSTSGPSGGLASFRPENCALRAYLVTVDYATASLPSVRTRSSWMASRAIPFIRR